MFNLKNIAKAFKLLLLAIIISVIGYFSFYFLTRNLKSDEVITIEATFMQYACGDENDDMKVNKVNLKGYSDIVGKDIDPQIFPSSGFSELKEYFYHNRTSQYGLKYRIKGRLSKFQDYGCDHTIPKFWVEEIEKIDGTNRKTKLEFSKNNLKSQ